MSDAERDENRVPTMIGVDKDEYGLDNASVAKIAVDPDSGGSGLPGVIVEIAA